MSLAALPDGRVLHSALTGEIRLHDPRTGTNNIVTDMKESPQGLYQHDEEGVQGIALDPSFGENRWVYVYYAPKLDTPTDVVGTGINEGDAPENLDDPAERARLDAFTGYNVLSRFKFAAGKLDFSTEQEILRVDTSRGICCHVGGKIDFDGDGNLYLSTGDDTNPFQSSGYAPIDDRENRNPAFDARRSAGNTNDLRGKILRIHVRDDGSYYVPRGNLFRQGQSGTRPEIYVMGVRNPFRFSVNRVNGDLYVGDYSPDAQNADPARGPAGTGRWFIVRRAGNYGWPFCATPDQPYIDFDLTPDSEQSGQPFNCHSAINDSRNNTGLRRLPQVVWPDVWYSYNTGQDLFPELFQHTDSNGISPMGGPAMQFDRDISSPFRWPRAFSGQPIFYEWSRDYAKVMELDRPNGHQLRDIQHLFGGAAAENPNVALDNPMDMEFGPDNALYTLEYGTGYFAELRASGTPTAGTEPPLTVQFSSAGTADANGDRLRYQWDFESDGTVDSTEANPSHTFTERGIYEATLRVVDQTGRSASWQVRVTVGNQAPKVALSVVSTTPPFDWGDTVHFKVTVTDDQPVDCARVQVAYILGHETHGHPQTSTAGCEGDIAVPPLDAGHAGASNLARFAAGTFRRVLEAAFWGFVGGAALLVGAVVGLKVRTSQRTIGLVMAFGAGVLISALTFELTAESFERGGASSVVLGLAAGGIGFFAGDWMLDHRGGDNRKRSGGEQAGGSGSAIVLGALMDGIPESVAIGVSLLGGGGVGIATVAAVFLSNVPESLSAATGLQKAGHSGRWIVGLWLAVAVVSAIAAGAGYALLGDASPWVVAFIQAFAAGAILTMLADTMMPESFEHGGNVVGLVTLLGFALAFLLSSAE